MKSKIILFWIFVVIVIIGVFVVYKRQEAQNEQAIVCTMEAKICPDGSAVGRTGPSCEFTACPEITSLLGVSTTTATIGQKIMIGDISITPLAILEDSRCPAGVQCIQAGTVRLKVKLENKEIPQEVILKLGVPTTIDGKEILLEKTLPIKSPGKVILESDYMFSFVIHNAVSINNLQGILSGQMSIGPVCTVEIMKRFPDYPCKPTPEMYAAAQVFVYKPDKKTLVTIIIPDKYGNFSRELPEGQYFVDMVHQRMGGTTGVPTTIVIKKDAPVILNLIVDTGLR